MDIISLIVVYGAEQAFIWMGTNPSDRNGFYVEQGRMLQRLRQVAVEKEVPFIKGDF